jgi:hypothetical protein
MLSKISDMAVHRCWCITFTMVLGLSDFYNSANCGCFSLDFHFPFNSRNFQQIVYGLLYTYPYFFQADFENPLCWRHPLALWFRGGGRAPASKASHFSWHKTAGRCCTCQHKGVLAASTNRFWPSAHSSLFVSSRFRKSTVLAGAYVTR